jgi:hypothetical protein
MTKFGKDCHRKFQEEELSRELWSEKNKSGGQAPQSKKVASIVEYGVMFPLLWTAALFRRFCFFYYAVI